MQRGSDGKESACSAADPGLIPRSGRSPGESGGGCGGQSPVLLPGEFRGQRSLEGYSPWGHKESNTAKGLTLSRADDTSLMAESEEKPLDEGEIGE